MFQISMVIISTVQVHRDHHQPATILCGCKLLVEMIAATDAISVTFSTSHHKRHNILYVCEVRRMDTPEHSATCIHTLTVIKLQIQI